MKTHLQTDLWAEKSRVALSQEDWNNIKKGVSFGFVDQGVHVLVIPNTFGKSRKTLKDILTENALTRGFSEKGYFDFVPHDAFALQTSFIDGVLEGPTESGDWIVIYKSDFDSYYAVCIYPVLKV